MKLLTYSRDGADQVGVLASDQTSVIPLRALGCPVSSMQQLIEESTPDSLRQLSQAAAAWAGETIPLSQVGKRPPVPLFRRDMICIGYNFKNHAQEIAQLRGEAAQTAEVAEPIYFSKRTAYATGEGDPVPYVPGYAENLDCGVEAAVVIGRDAWNITQEEAGQYIFGYTVANDLCDTRLNKVYTQPFLGKSMDGYMPIGPWIVTADEFPENPDFHLRLWVNDKLRQEGTTASLVFSIPYIVSQLSRNMTLKAGTMISTGSPANRDAGNPEKLKIYPGDVIRCEIDGIGSISNPVVEIV